MKISLKILCFLGIGLCACKKQTILSSLPANTIVDVDNNIYNTVQIGNQTWMAENLRVSRYQNGDSIRNVKDSTMWFNSKTAKDSGAWCNYNNNVDYDKIFGKLYNFYSVKDPRGLAPKGWHIPTQAEWDALATYLGGANIAGGKLKSTAFWEQPNIEATNELRFSALPAGTRLNKFTLTNFAGLLEYTCFWSSSQANIDEALYYILNFDAGKLVSSNPNPKVYGFSIRCIKD